MFGMADGLRGGRSVWYERCVALRMPFSALVACGGVCVGCGGGRWCCCGLRRGLVVFRVVAHRQLAAYGNLVPAHRFGVVWIAMWRLVRFSVGR